MKGVLHKSWDLYLEEILKKSPSREWVPPDLLEVIDLLHKAAFYAGAGATVEILEHSVRTDDKALWQELKLNLEEYVEVIS